MTGVVLLFVAGGHGVLALMNPGQPGWRNCSTELGPGVGTGHDISGVVSYSRLSPSAVHFPGW
jgi:hypothetical protein